MRYVAGLCLLLLPCFAMAQPNATEVLRKMSAAITTHKSMSYDVRLRFKFFSGDDTLNFSTPVGMERFTSDTVFGGKFWFRLSDTSEKLYDLKKIFHAEPAKKLVTRYSPHQRPDDIFIVTTNTQSRVMWPYFLDPERLKALCDTANRRSLLKDTTINGKDCFRLHIQYPDEDEFTGKQTTICLDKKTMVPVWQCSSVQYQGSTQYSEYSFSHIRWDNSNLVSPARYSHYKVSDYDPEPDSFVPKKLEGPAPALAGYNYSTHTDNYVADLKGKVTILDFWYMGCHPCIKAIPHINRLYNEYKTLGLQVLGINSFDNTSPGQAKLPQFLGYNTIDYPILLVNDSVPKKYEVRVWPTLYVIGKDGNIVYSGWGYSDSLYYELKTVIDKHIK